MVLRRPHALANQISLICCELPFSFPDEVDGMSALLIQKVGVVAKVAKVDLILALIVDDVVIMTA